MKVLFLIWTVIIIIGAVLLSVNVVKDNVYSGTDLSFKISTQRTLSIDTTSEIALQAASSDFFLLRKLSGETVVGTPTEPPLGWEHKTYYVAKPTQIQGGQWLVVEDGDNATLYLTSDSEITVIAAMSGGGKTGAIFLVLLAGAIIWLGGMLLAAMISENL